MAVLLTQPAHWHRGRPDRVGIGLLGHGTVGSGVVAILHSQRELLRAEAGVDFDLVHVLIRDVEKPRGTSPALPVLTTNADAIINDPNVHVVVECIGGTDAAADYVARAISLGKHVVTANKDLLAAHGAELEALADNHGVTLWYEAAVGGAIPVIRLLRESLAGERILEIAGVVNGTTNFILSAMAAGSTYGDALKRAQELGFAEADPRSDVEGLDAAHKLALLSRLAFRRYVQSKVIPRRGITDLTPEDLDLGKRLGYTLKLLAFGRDDGSAALTAAVTPVFVPVNHLFAQPEGPQCAIRVTGQATGALSFIGTGAGQEPTASAMVGDLLAVLRHMAYGTSFRTNRRLANVALTPPSDVRLPHVLGLGSADDLGAARSALERAGYAPRVTEGAIALAFDELALEDRDLMRVLEEARIAARRPIPIWVDR
ncbi:MAG TPA: homoserine dehydrogenase [Candidatus Dormibacteraeota bacterium]|nr:homoserine dehydrogenase [Candidatus Dormibacteraeota bacterium]